MTKALLNRVAICAVLDDFFHGLDTRDKVLIERCFTADAQVELHYGTAGQRNVSGAAAIAQNFYERHIKRAASNHMASHRRITIEGDRAQVETFAIAHLVPEDRIGSDIIVRGLRYEDELVRAGDEWRIHRRRHFGLWQYQAVSVTPSA